MKNGDKGGNKEAVKGAAHKETWRCVCVLCVFESLYCTVGSGPTLEGNPLPRLHLRERRERVNHDDACALLMTRRHVRTISGACRRVTTPPQRRQRAVGDDRQIRTRKAAEARPDKQILHHAAAIIAFIIGANFSKAE